MKRILLLTVLYQLLTCDLYAAQYRGWREGGCFFSAKMVLGQIRLIHGDIFRPRGNVALRLELYQEFVKEWSDRLACANDSQCVDGRYENKAWLQENISQYQGDLQRALDDSRTLRTRTFFEVPEDVVERFWDDVRSGAAREVKTKHRYSNAHWVYYTQYYRHREEEIQIPLPQVAIAEFYFDVILELEEDQRMSFEDFLEFVVKINDRNGFCQGGKDVYTNAYLKKMILDEYRDL